MWCIRSMPEQARVRRKPGPPCPLKRGVAWNSPRLVLSVATQYLPRALIIAKIPPHEHDEVSSHVLEVVWRWWIPEARRRYLSGEWSSEVLHPKLRAALVEYAKKRSLNVWRFKKQAEMSDETIRRRAAEVSKLDGAEMPDRTLEPGGRSDVCFLERIEKLHRRQLKAAGRSRARAALRLALAARRAFGKKGPPPHWPIRQFMEDAFAILECIE